MCDCTLSADAGLSPSSARRAIGGRQHGNVPPEQPDRLDPGLQRSRSRVPLRRILALSRIERRLSSEQRQVGTFREHALPTGCPAKGRSPASPECVRQAPRAMSNRTGLMSDGVVGRTVAQRRRPAQRRTKGAACRVLRSPFSSRGQASSQTFALSVVPMTTDALSSSGWATPALPSRPTGAARTPTPRVASGSWRCPRLR
jgi:hypothetical protein